MNSTLLERLETQIDDLPETEQRQLLERLSKRLDSKAGNLPDRFSAELDAMASDPEIRRELAAIEQEFQVADADGLDNMP